MNKYIYQEFPKVLYHADGSTFTAQDKDAEDIAAEEGFFPFGYKKEEAEAKDDQKPDLKEEIKEEIKEESKKSTKKD